MLECGNGKPLKDEIQNILENCQFPRFEENDFEFIKEMIDDPKDISTGVSKTFVCYVFIFYRSSNTLKL
jgi:hypothetical protein